MNPKNSAAFWLAVAALVLALGAALSFLAGRDAPPPGAPPPASPAAPRLAAPAPREETAAQVHSGETAKLQQMIDSGRFAPPPGNTEKMHSIASPFSAGARAQAPATPRPAGANGSQTTVILPGTLAANPRQNDSRPAPAARPPSAPAGAAAPPQPVEFETPPGIGSSKGGQ